MRWGKSSKWIIAVVGATLLPLGGLSAHGFQLHHSAGAMASTSMIASAPIGYTLKIAGCAQGSGQAQLSGTSLSISASVNQEGCTPGSLVASNLTVDATSHFRGTGTWLGKSLTIGGRLDDPQEKDTQLKASRLVGTFVTSDGSYGRIVGYVPAGTPAATPFTAH
jgi:hypothetical protein